MSTDTRCQEKTFIKLPSSDSHTLNIMFSALVLLSSTTCQRTMAQTDCHIHSVQVNLLGPFQSFLLPIFNSIHVDLSAGHPSLSTLKHNVPKFLLPYFLFIPQYVTVYCHRSVQVNPFGPLFSVLIPIFNSAHVHMLPWSSAKHNVLKLSLLYFPSTLPDGTTQTACRLRSVQVNSARPRLIYNLYLSLREPLSLDTSWQHLRDSQTKNLIYFLSGYVGETYLNHLLFSNSEKSYVLSYINNFVSYISDMNTWI